MAACVYCGLDAHSVIEVRYARTIRVGSVPVVDDDEAPREILGRGYYICDGCLALLDWHTEHHLDAHKHSLYNLASVGYFLFGLWGVLAVGSLAGTLTLLRNQTFLIVGVLLAVASLLTWFGRASVHARYYGHWREQREKPRTPRNSLTALTGLRDKVNPELSAYLPVRFEDSLRLAEKPGSPPIRSLGPNGEPWGQGPQTNFGGRGDNEWYRLVWISYRLWPLTHVQVPPGSDWQPPPPPAIHELEVGVATAVAGLAGIAAFAAGQGVWVGLGVGLVLAPVGFLLGRFARERLTARRREKYSGPAVPGGG